MAHGGRSDPDTARRLKRGHWRASARCERAEQLVREVVDLYGAALARIVALTDDPAAVERLAADDLVASLLLVHGLHPHDAHRRVADALDTVRPYLGSHGGDVDLLGITDGDAVRLARSVTGSCKTCPSSAVTLELAVEDAVRAAAPEITAIEVVAADEHRRHSGDPGRSLLSRVHAHGPHRLAPGARACRAGARARSAASTSTGPRPGLPGRRRTFRLPRPLSVL